MKVRDVMQTRLATIDEEDNLGLALQQMLWREVRHLPVMRGAELVGVLSERDILRARAELSLAMTAKVKAVMQTPAIHIRPNADLADAAAEMSTKALGCMPVVDTGTLVGIITPLDVLGHMAQYPVPQHPGPRAADLMTSDPLTVSPDDLLVDAAAKMTQRGIRHLCVVDGDGIVLGMLSDRDLRTQIGNVAQAAAERSPSVRLAHRRVSHAMTTGARVVIRETPLSDLVNIFLLEHVGAVPVVDVDNRIVGIVSYIDVLRAVAAGVVD